MVHAAPRTSHPVICVDTSSASGTLSAELSVDVKIIAAISTPRIIPRVNAERGGKGGITLFFLCI